MVKWCLECDVPIIGNTCELCGQVGRYCSIDLKPVFDQERILLGKLLNVEIPSFSFRHQNRIISHGRTFLTFRIHPDGQGFMLRQLKAKQDEIDIINNNPKEKLKLMIRANKSTLKRMEKEAIESIKKVSEEYSNIIVLFGGGKDSSVVALIAKKALGKVPLLFIDTTLEFPETYQFINTFAKKYNFHLIKDENNDFYRAKQDFFKLCKKLGPPSIYYRWCCHIFKEQPVRQFLNDFGTDDVAFLTGIRKYESRRRNNYSTVEFGRKITGQILIQPIINWRDIDVWLYTLWKRIDINALYKIGYHRVGCWPCPCVTPIMNVFRQITHLHLWSKMEHILCDYAKKNNRSEKWVKMGLWRLRKPKRQRIFIDPLETFENDGKLFFRYNIPYKETLLERLRILGSINIIGKDFVLQSDDFRIIGLIRKDFVELKIEFLRTKFANIKKYLERILFRYLNCIGCGACVSSCPRGAMEIREGILRVSEKCNGCRICLENSCIMEEFERPYVVKLTPFLIDSSECKSMKHVVFASRELRDAIAEMLRNKGIKVRTDGDKNALYIDNNVPRWLLEIYSTNFYKNK